MGKAVREPQFCAGLDVVSGAVLAAKRPSFLKLLTFARAGDPVYVYAVDRLGRDAIDVQSTVKTLWAKNVCVNVRGLGLITRGVGELIVAVLAQVAEMKRERIRERTRNGRNVAKSSHHPPDDMCKGIDRGMTITDVRVREKHGGRSSSFVNT